MENTIGCYQEVFAWSAQRAPCAASAHPTHHRHQTPAVSVLNSTLRLSLQTENSRRQTGAILHFRNKSSTCNKHQVITMLQQDLFQRQIISLMDNINFILPEFCPASDKKADVSGSCLSDSSPKRALRIILAEPDPPESAY